MPAKAIPFVKMVASGNDFVVVDNRGGAVKNLPAFTREVCRLHTGVGADGVLLIERSRRAEFKMRILNSDGSEADACGNGFRRCVARYAHARLGAPADFCFESGSGLIAARVRGGRVRVRLATPRDFRAHADLSAGGGRLCYSFINTGVPHAVIFVKALGGVDVGRLGRAVRAHRAFRPRGTNVNFVKVAGRQAIDVRTYERGVEAETLACGTGSTASAIVSSLLGFTRPPVKVRTRGGETLTVDFKYAGGRVAEAYLEGAAHFVFEGTLLHDGSGGKA
jgi:diaminopimelate epimerase